MGRLLNNPSMGWVNPKSTHVRPLTWDTKKTEMTYIEPKKT